MKITVLAIVLVILVGCDNEDVGLKGGSTVHLAGVIDNGTDGGLGSYWKDGSYSRLSDGEGASRPASLYVENSSVLIGGSKQGTPTQAVIWKDGVENIIENSFGAGALALSKDGRLYAAWFDLTLRWVYHKDGVTQAILDTALNFQPTGLALLGKDLYTAGNALEPTSEGDQHAQVWKNGQLIFREEKVSYTASIFIHDNDIYMGGFLYSRDSPNVACYWKNGNRVDLSDGRTNTLAKSIFVTKEHIYVAGMIDNQAAYWKDGKPVLLTNGGSHSMCNSIFIHGNDVYVAGVDNGHPAYWKNNVKQHIEHEEKPGQILFVTVGSNNY